VSFCAGRCEKWGGDKAYFVVDPSDTILVDVKNREKETISRGFWHDKFKISASIH